MPSVDHLTDIADKIAELIESMTIAGEYFHDWGKCNSDTNMGKVLPYANISYDLDDRDDSDEIGEDSLESTLYDVFTVEFKIEVTPPTIEMGPDAKHRNMAAKGKVLADLKRLFQKNIQLSEESVIYQKFMNGSIHGGNGRNASSLPQTVNCICRVRYEQIKEF